ncbi:acyltransferase [Ramlibacter sp. XY19]|uniref:acyltransferase family protein n=1 Tax=Ramlibacter paludis TaxID=2908000 RepID=UPI0023DC69FC|nr:acyltransferase [Ramlibacter paludis]MCG2593765.1 acyltransferase [Ramlibacter paludis]
MKSSSGAHYAALDHVRAVAVFIVIAWHFFHGFAGGPVPMRGAPNFFPLALLDEGHTGVALFMTLSGYLFAKLIGTRRIDYGAFLLNRALRLLPLLLLVLAIVGAMWVHAGAITVGEYLKAMGRGTYWPVLPNGAWSITVEAHFYLILPLLLLAARRSPAWLLGLVAAAVLLRAVLWWRLGQVQGPAYWSLVGRFDQFALGMFFFHARRIFTGRHVVAAGVFLLFSAMYWLFDLRGGFDNLPVYPSPSPFWIVLPTLEGAAYGLLIAWYESSFTPGAGWFSRTLARFGELSYSIYLLHFFFVFEATRYVHTHVMAISNIYLALAWTVLFYAFMFVPAWLSYTFVESPFLRLRRPYIKEGPAVAPSGGQVLTG